MDVEEGGLGGGKCVCGEGGGVMYDTSNPYILLVSTLYSCRTEVCIIIGNRGL